MNTHNCVQELNNVGLKATEARLGILSVLEKEYSPLDVDAIAKNLKKNHVIVDKVTIFRVMNALTKTGIVNPIQFNEGKLRYEYAARPDHHHFMCDRCGVVTDIDICNVDRLIAPFVKKEKVHILRHSLEFFGLCASCNQQN